MESVPWLHLLVWQIHVKGDRRERREELKAELLADYLLGKITRSGHPLPPLYSSVLRMEAAKGDVTDIQVRSPGVL